MPTILIVDDSAFQRASLRKALTKGGYDVIEAGNGDEALRMAGKRRVDGILTDLIMPDMRGLAVLESLQRQGSKVPVVVLTTDIQESVRHRCLEMGAARVLHKPVKPEVLKATFAEVFAPE